MIDLIFFSLSCSYQVVNETAMGGSTFDAIKQTINHYVILGFLSMFAGWIGWTSWIIAAERQIRRIRFKLFRNMLRQEIGWFDLHNAGELNSRLVNDLGME
jgi:ABC-type multidrug transport system fused ATPase/permease subunit